MSATALIGCTGFVGGQLMRQRPFDHLYHSKNIGEIADKTFDLVVCAGVSAVKWKANKEPEADWRQIQILLDALSGVKAGCFVLISTIDVYPDPRNVDEGLDLSGAENHPYGRHRYRVEEFVRSRFPEHFIVRLPGLFGEGLKKNVIYDLLHGNGLETINPESVFQYYALPRLWEDIRKVMGLALPLVNFATEPVATRTILERFFPRCEVGGRRGPPAFYDFKSKYAVHWSGKNGYLYDAPTVLKDLEGFIAGYSGG
jgi:hypothetical protein